MAIVFDDKQKQDAQAQAQGPDLSNQSASAPMGAQGTESAFSTSPVSSAGVGSGGTGGWTNIQSYLMANQGNDKSAGVLRSTVGTQFDKERSDFSGAKSEAEKRVQPDLDRTNMSQDAASKAVQDAGKLYGYGATQGSEYNAATSGLRGATRDYAGDASPWAYGTSADTQRYGTALQSNPGFQGLMSDLYRGAAGGQMGKGALDLQRQIDQDNDALNTTRSNLTGDYGKLTGDISQGITDANTKIQNDIGTVNTRAKGMRGYLGDVLAGTELGALDTDVTGANNWIGSVGPSLSSAWQAAEPQVNPTLSATANTTATRSNIISPHRSNWNVIQDVLGSGGKIDQQPALDPSSINYTMNGHIGGDGWGVSYGPANLTLEQLLGWRRLPTNMPRPVMPGYFSGATVEGKFRPNLGRRI